VRLAFGRSLHPKQRLGLMMRRDCAADLGKSLHDSTFLAFSGLLDKAPFDPSMIGSLS